MCTCVRMSNSICNSRQNMCVCFCEKPKHVLILWRMLQASYTHLLQIVLLKAKRLEKLQIIPINFYSQQSFMSRQKEFKKK